MPHFLAALLQAQYESFRETTEANIRTLITLEDSKNLVKQAGWNVVDETVIPSKDLQDGSWEVDMTLSNAPEAIASISTMPDKFKILLSSQLNSLTSYHNQKNIQSMDTFSFIATK